MKGSFFGELYLRSTLPFLSEERTRAEVEFLAGRFSSVEGPGPIVDVGCGHGRHSAALAAALGRKVIGVERDPESLLRRVGAFPAVRGDFRALPMATGCAAGAFAWYSTLFVFEDHAVHVALVQEIARVMQVGAQLFLHTSSFERLAGAPAARFSATLPDGSHLTERSEFDARTGVDRGFRELELPDGRVLSGRYSIRYYRLAELEELLNLAGFELISTWGGFNGEPPSAGATDLIVGARRRDA